KSDKCLIIQGARQIGKTTIVREFGKAYYDSFIELNFIEEPSCCDIFSDSLQSNDIIMALRLNKPDTNIIDGKTLIFLDEIQSCPKAITALKFMAKDNRYDVICSGSALGIAYNNADSYPVGSIDYIDMHALDFREFLWALNIIDEIIDELSNYFISRTKVPQAIHDKMMEYLKQYIVVGGMPEVVATFVKDRDYYVVDQIQRRLYRDYINDIAHYASGDIKIKAENCYKAIPAQLLKENHKFQYKLVEKKGTDRKFESCIDWLVRANMAYLIKNVKSISFPLNAYEMDDNFRIYPNDIGLLICTYPYELKIALLNDSFDQPSNNLVLGSAKGGIYEALACDILQKNNVQNIHFFRNEKSTIEIEFLLETMDGIIPLEVKAGRQKTKSLNTILMEPFVPYGYKFSSQNIGVQEDKITMPLYMLMFVK
ncbi:MAG: AAA family ATPase, partial [Firmicutes bacterium]|nr:AAA family ATPase [Bacillota bacterium]